ncbi:recombination regulator RecX [Amantichitinum ursilacus]|uniref:Regulatory protein RecX n=1 Tax=Amantichitinum ursilacus TaxID=857265 RepID=A0A0N1JTR4_9NEIS|nr:recombination regulator RecX [Amantichitinum ursilacus]KPC55245.1 Regulatory protein RecX [Amantichitinum ursilacus]
MSSKRDPTPTAADLRNRGLRLLARREHSRGEMHSKLKPYTPDEETLNALLDDFEARKWLSDERFAEQWTHFRSERYGSRRLAAELRQKGVASEVINEALDQVRDGEAERAHALWQRRFGQASDDPKERTRQLRFLAARGFSPSVIYRIVGGAMDDEFDVSGDED